MSEQTNPPTPVLLQVADVASAISSAPAGVCELIYEGKLKAVKWGDRAGRIPVEAFDKFISELRPVEPPPSRLAR